MYFIVMPKMPLTFALNIIFVAKNKNSEINDKSVKTFM